VTEKDDQQAYRDALADLGVDRRELDAAATNEQLVLLIVEHLLAPGPAIHDQEEVAEKAGMRVDESRRLWRAMGMPDARPGEKVFTDADVEALSMVAELLRAGVVEPELALQMARVMGSSLSRVSEALVGAIVQRVRDGSPVVTPEAGVMLRMPELLQYVWQRQMQASARRRLALLRDGDSQSDVAVGFADLVGFTALSQQLSDRELALVVDRFEALAFDTLAALGGRVVKMIGDEVMFVADDCQTAAEIGLTLSETYADDEALSDVRVGLACGPALDRDGDLYGPVVNLASRIVNIAYPGSVVTSDEFHDALEDDERFAWRSLRRRYLKDIGRVPLWVMRRTGDVDISPLARARAEGKAVRAEVLDRIRTRAGRLIEET
jgi:adenylate cyclase